VGSKPEEDTEVSDTIITFGTDIQYLNARAMTIYKAMCEAGIFFISTVRPRIVEEIE